jgi:hypothetical protein
MVGVSFMVLPDTSVISGMSEIYGMNAGPVNTRYAYGGTS